MMPAGKSFFLLFSLLSFYLLLLRSAGSHRLQYNLIAQSNHDNQEFSALGYLNGELFLYYESKMKRPELRGTSLETVVDTDTWKKENSKLKELGQELLKTLAQVMSQSHQTNGSHILQAILGCELHKDDSTQGFWSYGYEGQEFLTLQMETLTWRTYHPAAIRIKNAFEAESQLETKIRKAFVEGDCPHQLKAYLADWKENETAVPVVIMTQKKNLKGIILTCSAYNFSPEDIKLTWLKDGHALNHKDQEQGVILPCGDGTYQTWMSIFIYPDESNYTCHVEHHGNNQSILVLPEIKDSVPEASWRVYYYLAFPPILLAVVVAFVFIKVGRNQNVSETALSGSAV